MKKKVFILLILLGLYVYNLEFIKDNKRDANLKVKDNIKSIETSDVKNDFNKIDNFESIKIGSSKEELINKIGKPSRIDSSEYSFDWYVYNQNIEKFAMVGVEDGKVVGIYSNSIDSNELEGIKLNYDKDFIRNNYTPLEYKKKGNTRYIINSNDQYDIINFNNKYITLFYDIYENNKICSYQIISEDAEKTLNGIYPKENESIKESFELQTIDLVNSTRVKRGLNSLSYSDEATISSRKHSNDMMKKNYFDHTNIDNETPFDRMRKEGIDYMSAGENIAAGQSSAIYAHEAWMNSEGHRKNILGDYKYIGVGVIFGGHYTIYYTQNFYL